MLNIQMYFYLENIYLYVRVTHIKEPKKKISKKSFVNIETSSFSHQSGLNGLSHQSQNFFLQGLNSSMDNSYKENFIPKLSTMQKFKSGCQGSIQNRSKMVGVQVTPTSEKEEELPLGMSDVLCKCSSYFLSSA